MTVMPPRITVQRMRIIQMRDAALSSAFARQRRRWLLSAAVSLGGMASAQALAKINKPASRSDTFPKPEKKTLVIAMANRHALVYLPLAIAEQLGLFARAGLELEIIEMQSSGRAQQAVQSGAADIVCGWLENALTTQGRGQVLQSFVLMGRSPQISLGFSSRLLPGDSLASKPTAQLLRGRKVGVFALGSPTHTVGHAMLQHVGLRSHEMSFLSVGSAASATAALRSGQIDALAYGDPLMTQLQQRGEIVILAKTYSPAATQLATGTQLPSSCLFASADFLQRAPGLAQASCDAMVSALRWLAQASLLDIMKLLPDLAMGDDRQAFIGSLERMREALSPDGIMPPNAPAQLLTAMNAAEPTLRLEAIDPSKSFTNAFAKRSALRLTS